MMNDFISNPFRHYAEGSQIDRMLMRRAAIGTVVVPTIFVALLVGVFGVELSTDPRLR